MKNFKKYLVVFVLLFVALVLVACEDAPVTPPEPEEVKISSIDVYPTIYDGDEAKPYVLVDQDIYFECEINEDATEKEVWSIDDPTVATLSINEEGGVICKGLKGGNATVTAKSPDGSVSDSVTFEVCTSKNAQDVLVAANAEIIAAFPKYIAGDVKLPVPANPNVVVKYKTSITNGITVDADGVYKYAYDASKGDVNKAINFTITYHGEKLDSNTYFYEVKDAKNNVFVTIDKINEYMSTAFDAYTVDPDNAEKEYTLISENITLPTELTAEQVGIPTKLEWTSGVTSIISASGVYNKPAVDTPVLLTYTITIEYARTTDKEVVANKKYYTLADGAFTEVANPTAEGLGDYYQDNTVPAAKGAFTVVAAGTTPEEVIQYFINQKYCPKDGDVLTSSTFKLLSSDSSKKYAGLSVEWTADDLTKISFKKANQGILLSEGELTLIGTFYYNKQILTTGFLTKDKALDESKTYYVFDMASQSYKAVASPVVEDIATYYELIETVTYAWMREVSITIEYKKK